MASTHEDEVIADSEDEYGGDAVPAHRPNVIVPPRSSPEKTDTSSRNFFSTIETVSDFQAQASEKVSSISDFTAPPHPPTSVISSISTVSIAQHIPSDVVETITSVSSDYPDKPKKRPRPRPRVRPPKPASATEETNASPEAPPKLGDNGPTPSIERKAKILPEVVVLLPPLSKKRPSTSAPPREIVTLSSSDVEELPIQTAAKKRKLSNPAAGPSSPRPVAPARKSKTLLLSDDEGEDPIQLRGPDPSKSPRLSLGSAHASSLPTAKDPPATAKPIYDDDRFSDFDPSEPPKAAKKPKSKAKAKKTAAPPPEGGAEDEPTDQYVAGAPKAKKPRKSKGKGKRVDDEMAMPAESRDDGFKSKEFIVDSDEELGMPGQGPPADSPVRKRKAQEDISPPPKRAPINAPEGKILIENGYRITSKVNDAPEPQVNANTVDTTAVVTTGPKSEKPKKKRKSKVDKAPPQTDEGLLQTMPPQEQVMTDTVDEVMDAQDPAQPLDPARDSVKKPKSKSRPSHHAASDPLPNPSEPCEKEPTVEGASEASSNVGSTVTPAKRSPAPTKDRPSTPMSSSSAGPRGSIPYWRRPNKPLADLLNQATPGSSARPSGLHKSIRIAPLHMNRKPPPPPLPPNIAKKKSAKKGDGSDSEDDDETPRARLKRLAAEYESLEGMESKKANDRRKEITEELARLTN
ncbi:hypothetical protein FRC04_003085 [Tulasnella sp. 424]|nr:hypothetical protein FRC04_003085 [Tulasnella sp. 424]KAG8981124.1 hypothetical protein FRC05_004024 [Tulasnella sp. 425]